ncbi:MAG: hypothetical protein GDA36_08960 [Rhodobacteraceae bacterium]|nr:hypothetical protein [Paracoccaceae bacterium]
MGDTLTGNAAANTLTGLDGVDTLTGGSGADVLDTVARAMTRASYVGSDAVVVNLNLNSTVANGFAEEPEFRVNTVTDNSQWGPSVTALSDGGFLDEEGFIDKFNTTPANRAGSPEFDTMVKGANAQAGMS